MKIGFSQKRETYKKCNKKTKKEVKCKETNEQVQIQINPSKLKNLNNQLETFTEILVTDFKYPCQKIAIWVSHYSWYGRPLAATISRYL